MSNLYRVSTGSLLFILLYISLASCSNGPVTKTTTTTDSTKKDNTKKTGWVNPRKGKIWDKVNIVQIPLTAYENHILGNVKSVDYKDYKLSEKPDSNKVLDDSGHNVYDKAGHLIDQREYNADGIQKWKCIYFYDDKNKAIAWDFTYSNKNNQEKTAFRYDKNGKEHIRVTYGAYRLEIRKETRKYDANGNEIEIDREDTGKLKMIEAYKYDDKGNQTEWTERAKDGKLKWKLTCVYDNNGNKVEAASYQSDTLKPSIQKIKNDSLGRMTERVYYKPDGSLWSRTTMKYDSLGNMTEYLDYDKDGKLNEQASRYSEYAYDAAGNITKETEFKIKKGKRVAVSCTETKYTYY